MCESNQSIAISRLNRANLRATKHRISVLMALQNAARPLSHMDLLQLIEPQIDRVTLYRILSSLTDAALVHQVQGGDGSWRFCFHNEDSTTCPGGHPHLLCESCGTMTCLIGQKLPHFEVPESFLVTHKQMVISGICKACQNKVSSHK